MIKVGLALARLTQGEELRVMVREEALSNVFTLLKTDGHRIESVSRLEELFLLRVEKGGGSAGWVTTRERM
jgi:hypothetical protein